MQMAHDVLLLSWDTLPPFTPPFVLPADEAGAICGKKR
jgi:hypothetical protein